MSTTVYERNGNVLTVKPNGRLDTATSPVFEEELRPQLDGVESLIVDFSGVDYISSGGIRALLVIEQQMEEQDGDMKLIHVNSFIKEIFELVGFMEVVKVEFD